MTAHCHSLWVNATHDPCVARDLPPWHFAGVESDDKNGGPNNLRAWRVHRGLSQAALAEKVGTTTNMIQYLESGERGLSLKWLRRLADALETTPGHLADYDPNDVRDAEIFDFWTGKLDRDQRRQLAAIAEALTKTGTESK
jgi:transcriptional regulator with XRE-family HTH domain